MFLIRWGDAEVHYSSGLSALYRGLWKFAISDNRRNDQTNRYVTHSNHVGQIYGFSNINNCSSRDYHCDSDNLANFNNSSPSRDWLRGEPQKVS